MFLTTYALIVTDRMHRTAAALLGAGVAVALRLVPSDRAVAAVDLHTLGLLVGMMLIVGLASQSGLFDALAVAIIRASRGSPTAIFFGLAGVTAVASAFLDNVTTVLFVAPITLRVAADLGLEPEVYLIAEVLASNIGGAATLVGDPPNIMIGSAAGLGFLEFARNLAGIAAAVLLLTLVALWLWKVRGVRAVEGARLSALHLDPASVVRDHPLFWKSLGVIAAVVAGFFLEPALHVDSATVALLGATLMLALAGRPRVEEALDGVEWATVFFFVGLFVLVAALDQARILSRLAEGVLHLAGGSRTALTLSVLWLSGVTSAFVDNIPMTAAMIPLIRDLGALGVPDPRPLWWALALGANLGGNATLVGASANVIVAGIAEESGKPISFAGFLRVGAPLTLGALLLCSAYLYLLYPR